MSSIPGARTIENIIAALPTNVSQSIQIRQLSGQLAAAELKIVQQAQTIAELSVKVKDLEAKRNLSPDSLKILKYIFDHPRGYSSYYLSTQMALSESVIEYHFDCLRRAEFLKNCVDRMGDISQAMEITEVGRAFIVETYKV